MFNSFLKSNQEPDVPSFLLRSVLGVSAVAFAINLPFGINNFIQGRLVAGVAVSVISLLCVVNVYLCRKGHYSLPLNLFGIAPCIAFGCANAIHELNVTGSYWSYLAVFAIYFILPLNIAKYANLLFGVCVIAVAYTALPPDIYLRFSASLLGVSFFIYISSREIDLSQRKLTQQSQTDHLTGVLNRSCLQTYLEQAIQLKNEDNRNSTLCVLDIDHFKRINDQYGHDVGDNVLIELTKFIESMMSNKDTLFRIGGEEFLILMENTDAEEGFKTANALCYLLADTSLADGLKVTISIGVTELTKEYSWKSWMKQSDEKLYQAKQYGRNQVVI